MLPFTTGASSAKTQVAAVANDDKSTFLKSILLPNCDIKRAIRYGSTASGVKFKSHARLANGELFSSLKDI